MLTALGVAQIPLLAAMLVGGCSAKFVRAVQRRSIDAGLGPTALFPLKLRPWAAGTLCAVELGMGIGLIVTAGTLGGGTPAKLVRVGTCVLFVVATCALIELRSIRPDIGCGCFGEFSSTPITARTLLRSMLLAVAALGTVNLAPIQLPHSFSDVALTLIFFLAELGIFALLSPEVRDVLVRIGYSKPCELRVQSPGHTLASLQHTKQWRRNSALITNDQPLDVWRELCWRYLAFASRYNGRETELVFAVYLRTRRPIVLSALVDAATGVVIPSPVSARPVGWRWAQLLRRGAHAAPQPAPLSRLGDEPGQGRLHNPNQISGEPRETVQRHAI
jgi:Methylamine utilisation protein MauE